MANTAEPKSTTYTLCFKHGRQTILLFAEPLTTFPVILQELLEVLRERYPDGLPTRGKPLQIPTSVIDIVLGVPKDVYDKDKGWEELDSATAGLKESPKSLGLKDGAQIAFAFLDEECWKERGEFDVEFSNLDELYPPEEE